MQQCVCVCMYVRVFVCVCERERVVRVLEQSSIFEKNVINFSSKEVAETKMSQMFQFNLKIEESFNKITRWEKKFDSLFQNSNANRSSLGKSLLGKRSEMIILGSFLTPFKVSNIFWCNLGIGNVVNWLEIKPPYQAKLV